MSAEEIAKLLNTGNTEDSTLQTLLGDYFYSPTQSDGYSDCESDDDDDECDGLLLATPEQLHFTSQQQLSQHLEEQEEEYDDEEPLITPATSNTIVVEAEDLELDERAVDLREREEIEALYSSGCCARKCYIQFERDDLMRVRWDLQELTKDQLEMTILGHLMSTTSCETVERNRTEYEYRGKKICKKLFLFIYSIRNGTYKNLRRHFLQNGMKPRVHGNTGRIPCHALSVEGIKDVVAFLENYAEDYAILLPGRIPGVRDYGKAKLLPSSVSRRMVYRQYADAGRDHAFSESSFKRIWRKYVPHIYSIKPMTDLCWTCKKNSTAILRNAGCEIERQSEAIVAAKEHIDLVRRERDYFREVLKVTKDAIKELDLTIERPVNQVEVEVHYSFDYAQQVHYPSDPLQPGPIYFLTPRKCGLFGVCCEAFPRQVTYLVDEAMDTGKGANTVVSYVHHYIENHGINASMIHLNADNCTGQNKNNTLIQYLAWRVLTHRNKSIKISFLPVGHTKFSPDWCFGLIKQLFRKTAVGCLEDIAKVVDDSAVVNVSQLVGSSTGEVFVQCFDWTGFLQCFFKRIDGIKKIHHFTLEKDSLLRGDFLAQESIDSSIRKVSFLREGVTLPPSDTQPEVILPKGLSAERQWYLYEKIRSFCPDNSKDKTCPLPSVAKPSSSAHHTPEAPSLAGTSMGVPPAPKRRRKQQ